MNIANYFEKSSLEEREHAHKLMKYLNMRGGVVELKPIPNIVKANPVAIWLDIKIKTKKANNEDIITPDKIENVKAKKDYKKHEGRKSQLKSNRNTNDRVRIWYNTYCNNINNNIKSWAGYTSKHLKKQAERI